jgi:hypothetical protein
LFSHLGGLSHFGLLSNFRGLDFRIKDKARNEVRKPGDSRGLPRCTANNDGQQPSESDNDYVLKSHLSLIHEKHDSAHPTNPCGETNRQITLFLLEDIDSYNRNGRSFWLQRKTFLNPIETEDSNNPRGQADRYITYNPKSG